MYAVHFGSSVDFSAARPPLPMRKVVDPSWECGFGFGAVKRQQDARKQRRSREGAVSKMFETIEKHKEESLARTAQNQWGEPERKMLENTQYHVGEPLARCLKSQITKRRSR